MNNKVTFNVTNRTILRTILWVIFTIILFKFIGRISHELTLIFAAFFLALALNPAVSSISRHLNIKSRAAATTVAYLMVVVVLAAFFALITPPLVRQTRTFINDVPQTIQSFQQQDTAFARAARRYNLDKKISDGAKNFASHYNNFGSTLFDTGKRIVDVVASILAVVVMTFMMLVEGPRWLDWFWSLSESKKREHHKRIAHRMYKGVTGFVNGQVILAVVAGFCSFVVLEIASHIEHVSVNSVALAGIVAVFGLIPLFGNPIAAIIVILACTINSGALGLTMLLYFIIYFFIENHTLQPIIQSRLNELTPLTVFVAAILGVGFDGLLGAIIAIPAASALKVLLTDYYERRELRAHPVKEAI